MKRLLKVLCLTLSVSVISWSGGAQGVTTMPSQPYALCIGRFVIDLPSGATTSISASYKYIEPQQPKSVDSFDEIKKQIMERANKLEGWKIQRDPISDKIARAGGLDPDKLYGKTQLIGFDIDESVQQTVIGYHTDASLSGIITEVHKVIGHWDYSFQSKDGGADSYVRTRQRMWAAATEFTPISRRVVPGKAGFCVEGGYFADDGKPPVKESFTLVVKLAGRPDLRFTIDANAIDRVNTDELPLKHRVDSELGILRANVEGHVGVIERGERKAAGQDGYQIGIRAPYDMVPNTQIRKFFWSADGVPNDVTRPFMEIDLTIQPTDDGKTTVKDDAEAKELWETFMKGIRIRPDSV